MKNILAKIGLYLVNKFYVYKGTTYTVHLGRLRRDIYPKKDIRRSQALKAWQKESQVKPFSLTEGTH